eukprot:m.49390 g.49390  ORF g.49390 m.49390 type:complete len:493 (+) comp12074_c0_seq1:372-1850(+)
MAQSVDPAPHLVCTIFMLGVWAVLPRPRRHFAQPVGVWRCCLCPDFALAVRTLDRDHDIKPFAKGTIESTVQRCSQQSRSDAFCFYVFRYTRRKQALLHELLQQHPQLSRSDREEYSKWHDVTIGCRVLAVPIVFLLAFALSHVSHVAAYTCLGLILFLPLIVRAALRTIFRSNLKETYFLSSELAQDRLMAFGDGVFSIVLTLIVLDIDIPDSSDGKSAAQEGLRATLLGQWDQYLSYVYSFAVTSCVWVTNNQVLHHVKFFDGIMRGLHTTTLAIVGFIPFVSSIMSEYNHNEVEDLQLATRISSGVVILAGLVQLILWAYACFVGEGRFLSEDASNRPRLRNLIFIKCLLLPVCVGCTFFLSFVSPTASYVSTDVFTILAVVSIVLIQVFFPSSTEGYQEQPEIDWPDFEPLGGANADELELQGLDNNGSDGKLADVDRQLENAQLVLAGTGSDSSDDDIMDVGLSDDDALVGPASNGLGSELTSWSDA